MLLNIATLILALAAHRASAHATMFGVSVNGKDAGDFKQFIRSPATNDPVRDLKSPNIVCNTQGGKAAPSFVKAAAGDKLSFRWFHYNPADPADYVLDPSHKGAILTYIAPYTTGNGAGPIWSKLAEEGFEGGKWATIKMIDNKGEVGFTLPKALAAGKYLIRQELLALHMADFAGNDPAHPGRGAESYPSCVQVEVSDKGAGDAIPDQDFDFNTGYKYEDKGLHFNIYIPFDKYTPPGPRPWTGK
ncbi:putative endo-beta-1,4-glucanase D [Parachaetomium inaequale]|uniref:lytic cellulose monooxygenase (C4-dehydrogenating) n=1 Tax=Parachaetomium inaequale TaxID=2588326 RepID=A0AAN6PH67_9PEZI|nr:putative endo-beta-1,4-glucanase D [Parachaetomium inaequale]